MSYRTALCHLGSSSSKCTRLLKEIEGFYASIEEKFIEFKDNSMALKRILGRSEVGKEDVLMFARNCIKCLTAIKEISLRIIGASEEDEKIVMVEKEELLRDIAHDHERINIQAINNILRRIFVELQRLIGMARKDIHEAIDPEIAALKKIIEDVKELTGVGVAIAYTPQKQKYVDKLVAYTILIFNYVLGHAKDLKEEEEKEFKEIKTIEKLTRDLTLARGLLGMEFEETLRKA